MRTAKETLARVKELKSSDARRMFEEIELMVDRAMQHGRTSAEHYFPSQNYVDYEYALYMLKELGYKVELKRGTSPQFYLWVSWEEEEEE